MGPILVPLSQISLKNISFHGDLGDCSSGVEVLILEGLRGPSIDLYTCSCLGSSSLVTLNHN